MNFGECHLSIIDRFDARRLSSCSMDCACKSGVKKGEKGGITSVEDHVSE